MYVSGKGGGVGKYIGEKSEPGMESQTGLKKRKWTSGELQLNTIIRTK